MQAAQPSQDLRPSLRPGTIPREPAHGTSGHVVPTSVGLLKECPGRRAVIVATPVDQAAATGHAWPTPSSAPRRWRSFRGGARGDGARVGTGGGNQRLRAYRAQVSTPRPAADYTARVIPRLPGASAPLEEAHILIAA